MHFRTYIGRLCAMTRLLERLPRWIEVTVYVTRRTAAGIGTLAGKLRVGIGRAEPLARVQATACELIQVLTCGIRGVLARIPKVALPRELRRPLAIAAVGLTLLVFGLQTPSPALSEPPTPNEYQSESFPEPPPVAEAPKPAAKLEGHLARAVFATQIEDREPVDPVSTLPADEAKVYFFTELIGLQGRTVTHRWEYQGNVMAEVNFEVRGPRWRVFSSKNFLPEWTGDWKVRVVTDTGEVLGQTRLAYGGRPRDDAATSVPADYED